MGDGLDRPSSDMGGGRERRLCQKSGPHLLLLDMPTQPWIRGKLGQLKKKTEAEKSDGHLQCQRRANGRIGPADPPLLGCSRSHLQTEPADGSCRYPDPWAAEIIITPPKERQTNAKAKFKRREEEEERVRDGRDSVPAGEHVSSWSRPAERQQAVCGQMGSCVLSLCQCQGQVYTVECRAWI